MSSPLVSRNNIDNRSSSADVVRNNILNDIMDRLDRVYDVEVEKLLLLLNRTYDMLENPEKYKVFNKNCPKPITMKLIKTLGLIREQAVERWLRDVFPEYQGYMVKHWNNKDEPDLIVYKDDKPIMVVEVKNYAEKTYMPKPTFDKIIERFSKYNCFKLLILTSGCNLIIQQKQIHNNKPYYTYNTKLRETSEYLRSKGIYMWILGYQDLMSMKQFNEIVEFAKRLRNKKVNYEVKGWDDRMIKEVDIE
jgi:hypothetical protein